jgi:hypothetical protein
MTEDGGPAFLASALYMYEHNSDSWVKQRIDGIRNNASNA